MNTDTGRLTTHILDTSRGCPAANVHIQLYSIKADSKQLLTQATSNQDGRCDQPLLSGATFQAGQYQLIFEIGEYFGQPDFLDQVVIQFTISKADEHYHVPLLVSPYGYSTYRGS